MLRCRESTDQLPGYLVCAKDGSQSFHLIIVFMNVRQVLINVIDLLVLSSFSSRTQSTWMTVLRMASTEPASLMEQSR